MENQKQVLKFLKHFIIAAGIVFAAAALAVFLVDPFFHYHKPWFGLPAVLEEKEHQIPGVIDHFDYDSVLAGSSVVININTDTLDEAFSGKTIKAVSNSATSKTLCYYLRRAFKRQELNYVFYGLDVFSFYNSPDIAPTEEEVKYLVNKNPFDDVKYLWNRDILCETIPKTLSLAKDGYDEGRAYAFPVLVGKESVLNGDYIPGAVPEKMKAEDYRFDEIEENVAELTEIVESHPDTQFKFLMPPYTILWWDRAYREGMTDSYFHTLDYCMKELLKYPNVSIYSCRFNEKERIMDFSNYGDVIHGSPELCNEMALELTDESLRITADNQEEELEKLKNLVDAFGTRVETEGGAGFIWNDGYWESF